MNTEAACEKINLLALNLAGMKDFLSQFGEKSFRAAQIMQWIHQEKVTDFDRMTNLSKSLRQQLANFSQIKLPEIAHKHLSQDGTCKWLLRLSCGNCIETVFIPEKSRGTLCVSSQIGCALNCSFCATGKQGFNRNLTTDEIIGQVFIAAADLPTQKGSEHRRITNVVMMGMGEPLLNFDPVVTAIDIMLDDYAYGLSKRRVTLSTSGVVPEMIRLKKRSPVSLAVSLHAPLDEIRNILVPVNKKYPISMLMDVCKTYFENEPRRKVTFEYTMIKDVNDKPEHAKLLAKLLSTIPSKVNLIPFNTVPFVDYECSSPKAIETFQTILMEKGIHTTVRKTRGDDVSAACGQLAGEVKDRTSRSQRLIKMYQLKQENQ